MAKMNGNGADASTLKRDRDDQKKLLTLLREAQTQNPDDTLAGVLVIPINVEGSFGMASSLTNKEYVFAVVRALGDELEKMLLRDRLRALGDPAGALGPISFAVGTPPADETPSPSEAPPDGETEYREDRGPVEVVGLEEGSDE